MQVIDVVLHAATAQLEPLRVTANLVVLLGLALVAAGRGRAPIRLTAGLAGAAYLALNLIFLAQAGLTVAGGGLRVTLFLLVALTVALTGLLVWLHSRSATL